MIRFIGSFKKTFENNYSEDKKLQLTETPKLLHDNKVEIFKSNQTITYFWGYVYNQIEISRKYNFSFGNPAHFIFQIFSKAGFSGLKELDGEFSYVFESESDIILGRDRHGAGPQIYYNDDYYWSWLGDIYQIPSIKIEPDISALYVFLALGNINSPNTAFKSIKKIPPGHCLTIKNNKFELKNLFDFNDFYNNWGNTKLSESEIIEHYEVLHKQAVKQRIEGKSNIALLISGGYDSGGNIIAFRDLYKGKALSVSVGFKDDPWSEVPLAKLVSEKNDIDFYSYLIDGSEINDLPQMVNHFGDPFQESGLMVNFCAMKYASSLNPDLILGGDGNDQHFGTSAREVALNYLTRKSGTRIFQKLLNNIAQNDRFNKDNFNFKILFENEKVLDVFGGDYFGLQPSQIEKLDKQHRRIDPFILNQKIDFKLNSFDDFYITHNYFKDIQKVINEVILFKASRMADLYGNHITFPYMSTEIYQFLKQLPRQMKCKGSFIDLLKGKGVSKYTHKAYLKPRLPIEITARKKQGGFAPLPLFFKDDTRRTKIINFIKNSDFARQFFNPQELNRFLQITESSFSGPTYWFWYKQIQAFRLFNLLVLSLWWEIYINRNYLPKLENYYI